MRSGFRRWRSIGGLLAVLLSRTEAAGSTDAAAFLARQQEPVAYVLEKLETHRVVLLGESHFVRQDEVFLAELIAAAAPARLGAFASELFGAEQQTLVDRVTSAERWDRRAAMAILRERAWPYEEYLALLQAVWTANRGRAPGTPRLRLLALGPPADWRDALRESGLDYDSFMARRIEAALEAGTAPILAQLGYHHAFTRYLLPDRYDDRGRVAHFSDRAGNRLFRQFGEDVFLVSLQASWNCFDGTADHRCLPLDGVLDCAAARTGRPVGFDVAPSPFGNLPVRSRFYAPGHHDLRFHDLADGYVWLGPLDRGASVSLIPLEEFAPDEAALDEVLRRNPFRDERLGGRAEMQALWDSQAAAMTDYLRWRNWPEEAARWRDACGETAGGTLPPGGASRRP